MVKEETQRDVISIFDAMVPSPSRETENQSWLKAQARHARFAPDVASIHLLDPSSFQRELIERGAADVSVILKIANAGLAPDTFSRYAFPRRHYNFQVLRRPPLSWSTSENMGMAEAFCLAFASLVIELVLFDTILVNERNTMAGNNLRAQ